MHSSETTFTIFSTFADRRFTKATLARLCQEKGGKTTGSKKSLIDECLRLYTPTEVMRKLNVAERLPWYSKLIIVSLLSGEKSMQGILDSELAHMVLSQQLPAAAFGEVTKRLLSPAELKSRLTRRVYSLRKSGIILLSENERTYQLNPYIKDYLGETLGSVSAEQLATDLNNFASEVMREGTTELFKLFASLEKGGAKQTRILDKDWRAKLDRFRSLLKEIQESLRAGSEKLRFDAPFVKVSDLSKQYYCEQKVALTQQFGGAETEQMRAGGEAHESLLIDTIKVKREEAWQDIFSGKPTMLREMLLIAKRRNVILVGKTDAVIFENGVPVCLFDYKFTSRQAPFRDMHVQARTYCYLLHEMGFDTQTLKYALVFAAPQLSDDEELRRKLPWLVIRRVTEYPQESIVKLGSTKTYVNEFNLSESEGELDWALEFWTGQREAKPTTKPAKCKVCEHRGKCQYALVT
jgi:hypothetical protein